MKNKILLSLAIISCLAFTACGTNETVADSTSASENIVSENSVSESTVSESSVSESTVAESDTIEPESSQQGTISGYEAPVEDVEDTQNPNDIGIGYTPSEEEEEVIVEEETAPETEESVPLEEDGCNNTIPEDEVQWYLDTLGLTREQFNKLTNEQIEQMIMDWVSNGSSDGGSSSSGGSSGGGSSSGGNTPGYTEDGGLDEGVWGPVPELIPDEDVLPGMM
ncbi:MAG: hypothetical protein IJZ00_03005 [Lachnospiraceae bacterium]|nr:hypothetical protein [Lachnospiraceae bacterium]